MKFNIDFIIRGPVATISAPNVTNPVECANLASLLDKLKDNLPSNKQLGIEVVGIVIKQCGE